MFGFLSLVGILLGVASCTARRGPTVHLIVPDGFTGLIQILEDPSGEAASLEEGEYVYRIPIDGILKVRIILGFERWHYTVATFASGKRLPVYPENQPQDVALFEIGSSSSGKTFLFVGTEQQKERTMKDSFNLLC